MTHFRSLAVAAAMATAAAGAQAQTVLSGNLTVDNSFFVYLSTSAGTLGTLVQSGSDWTSTFSLSAALTPGTTYYLNVEAINWGLQGAFIGDFTLSNTDFHFANGTQSLSTDAANWKGGFSSGNSTVAAQPWVQPTGATFTEGLNGVGPWGTRPGIAATTQWIWASDTSSAPGGTTQGGVCPFCTVDFQTTITAAVPEPGSAVMLLSGAALMLLVARRRQRAR